MPKTTHQMIIHHPDRLHVGVHDRAADEFEATLFQIFAQRIGLERGGGRVTQTSPAVLNGLSIHESPNVVVEASEFVLNVQERPRVGDSRIDF